MKTQVKAGKSLILTDAQLMAVAEFNKDNPIFEHFRQIVSEELKKKGGN